MELQIKISNSTFWSVRIVLCFHGVHQYKAVMHAIESMVYTSQTLVRLNPIKTTPEPRFIPGFHRPGFSVV